MQSISAQQSFVQTETITTGRDEVDIDVSFGGHTCVHCGEDIYELADGTWEHEDSAAGDADLCGTYAHSDAADGEELRAATPHPIAEAPVAAMGMRADSEEASVSLTAADGTTYVLRIANDGRPYVNAE